MERPKHYDIWDGIELERDESLTEEEKAANIKEILARAEARAKARKAAEKKDRE